MINEGGLVQFLYEAAFFIFIVYASVKKCFLPICLTGLILPLRLALDLLISYFSKGFR